MNRTKPTARPARATALALCLCLAPGAAALGGQRGEPGPGASRAENPSKGFRQARQARPGAAPEAASFEFEMNGFSYRINANGNGRRTKDEKGHRTRRFNLRLDGRLFIETVYYSEYEGDLLLVCGVADSETGAGLVFRLGQPSMRALWRQELPAFNVGEPLRDGHGLYVTGIGFVARLDLRTGEFDWSHDDLYDTGADASARSFNSFEAPELAGDTVLFRERAVYNPRRATLVVDRKTGRIIRIE